MIYGFSHGMAFIFHGICIGHISTDRPVNRWIFKKKEKKTQIKHKNKKSELKNTIVK